MKPIFLIGLVPLAAAAVIAAASCGKSRGGFDSTGGGGYGGGGTGTGTGAGAPGCHPGGAPCQAFSECCSNVCANQVCTTCGAVGDACNTPGGCCTDLLCYDGKCASCKLDGSKCTLASDCCSNICYGGTCSPCHDLGQSCSQSYECCNGAVCNPSGYCDTGSTSTGSTSSSTTTGTTTSTSAPCDNTGTCTTCSDCAFSQFCQAELDACNASQQCIDYYNCFDPCTTQACADGCASTYPQGYQLFWAWNDCMICGSCYNDCDGLTYGCP